MSGEGCFKLVNHSRGCSAVQFVKLKIPAVKVHCDDVLFIVPGEQIHTKSLPCSIKAHVADHGVFAVGWSVFKACVALSNCFLNVPCFLLPLFDAHVTSVYP